MQRIIIDSLPLLKKYYTPTDIAILTIAVNMDINSFTLEQIMEKAKQERYLFITMDKLTNLIHKMIKDDYGFWDDCSYNGDGSEYSFNFNNYFLLNYCKLIDLKNNAIIGL